jgi:signal peptidase I
MSNEDFIEEKPKATDGESFWDLVKFGIMTLLIAACVRTFIAQPFIVSGSSMVPTFESKDYLIVDELSYHVGKPSRGDVVVFHPPGHETDGVFYIKRVIGIPGEKVTIKNGVVTITSREYPDGLILEEPYIKNKSNETLEKILGEDEYFVMGDNRTASADSRVWGVLPRDNIKGRAFLRLLPLPEIALLPGVYHNYIVE